jgi:hypothetical protein
MNHTLLKRFVECGSTIIFCAVAVVSQDQEIKRPPLTIPEKAESAAGFVPKGWRLEASTLSQTDLNGDGSADAAFVISNGGADDSTVVKHVLVLALRGSDGKLHRSAVSDAAVLDGDEGGVFGDPFDSLSIDHGVVVITHYGGSRDRWGFTHRYRFQNQQWTLIGLSIGNTDTLNLEHYDNQDINLSTGLVHADAKGSDDDQPKKPQMTGSYYELEVMPVDRAPHLDGQISTDEYPGYAVRLNQKSQVLRNRQLWKDADDLSARLHAVQFGTDLFLCAEVTDNEVTDGDTVRLVNRRGQVISPRRTKTTVTGNGYVVESLYSLKDIANALKTEDKYIVENLEMAIDPSSVYGDLQGFQLAVSVEVVDSDKSGARAVLSTRLAGSPYTGAIRIFRKGTLILTDDTETH